MTALPPDWHGLFADRADRMRASEIRELLKLLDQPDVISFAGGIPDPSLFPAEAIRQATDAVLTDDRLRDQALQYSVSEGYLPLRRWIVRYMAGLGVACDPSNIVITCGSQQALDFLGKLLLSPGDTALVTAPTYLGALQAFNAYQPRYGQLTPGGGNRTPAAYRDAAAAAGSRVKLAYVVPDFANPTGITLDLTARERLSSLAEALGIAVIEDGAYSALRYEGVAQPPLLALDIARSGSIEAARTIYCGTFSKTLAPALRIGWICAARPVIEKAVLIKQASDLHSATLNQMVMQRVADAAYDSQLVKLRVAYGRRRDAMLAALTRSMPAGVAWTRPEGGMFVWLTLPEGCDGTRLLARAIEEARLAFVPGRAFFADESGSNTIRLSFSLASEAQLDQGLARLGRLISETICSG